jgi:hypothetical protein
MVVSPVGDFVKYIRMVTTSELLRMEPEVPGGMVK